MQTRRDLMRTGLVAAGGVALGPASWEDALAAPARRGKSPYGPLGPADANGVRLPEGFRSRVIARSGVPVADTAYVWPIFPDGAATFRTRDCGWILVSNSEVPTAVDVPGPIVGHPGDGGASAIRFDADGNIVNAYRILSGTSTNCAGGATPWGTWLSCEEHEEGLVWECDPRGKRDAVARPAMGTFQHEAVCVDRRRGHLYLTEDLSDGGFYRFTPRHKGNLTKGRLEIAKVHRGEVESLRVRDPAAREAPTRMQVKGATEFKRGEGIWFDRGTVYIATTGDSRILAYDVRRKLIRGLLQPRPPARSAAARRRQPRGLARRRTVRLRGQRRRRSLRRLPDHPGAPPARLPLREAHGAPARQRRHGGVIRDRRRLLQPARRPDVLLLPARLRQRRV